MSAPRIFSISEAEPKDSTSSKEDRRVTLLVEGKTGGGSAGGRELTVRSATANGAGGGSAGGREFSNVSVAAMEAAKNVGFGGDTAGASSSRSTGSRGGWEASGWELNAKGGPGAPVPRNHHLSRSSRRMSRNSREASFIMASQPSMRLRSSSSDQFISSMYAFTMQQGVLRSAWPGGGEGVQRLSAFATSSSWPGVSNYRRSRAYVARALQPLAT